MCSMVGYIAGMRIGGCDAYVQSACLMLGARRTNQAKLSERVSQVKFGQESVPAISAEGRRRATDHHCGLLSVIASPLQCDDELSVLERVENQSTVIDRTFVSSKFTWQPEIQRH